MGKYDDIIHLPHPTSSRHPRMSSIDRAAQFAPFSALTGYDAVIRETGRQTQNQIDLGEYGREVLDRKQRILMDHVGDCPEVTVTYFVPDQRKSGGTYVSCTGNVKKVDLYRGRLVMTDEREIQLDRIVEMESKLFSGSLPEWD